MNRNLRGESRWRRLRQRHRRARQDALARLRQQPVGHAFALLLLALALLALLLLHGAVERFAHLAQPLRQAHALSLFLDASVDADGARALLARLRGDGRVAQARAISPQEGLAELLHMPNGEEALAALPDNPLPWVLELEPVDRQAATSLVEEWRRHEAVADVTDEAQLRERADAVLGSGRVLLLALLALVGAGALVLVANAVRTLRVEGAAERSLQRVFGASEADLRRPYLYLGGLYGLIAGSAALLLALLLLLALRPAFDGLAQAFAVPPAEDAGWSRRLLILPLAVLLGVAGAWLACLFERDLEDRA